MKKNLFFIAGVVFLFTLLQRTIFPALMKISFTPNDLLLDVGITLLSAIITVLCLFNYFRLLKTTS